MILTIVILSIVVLVYTSTNGYTLYKYCKSKIRSFSSYMKELPSIKFVKNKSIFKRAKYWLKNDLKKDLNKLKKWLMKNFKNFLKRAVTELKLNKKHNVFLFLGALLSIFGYFKILPHVILNIDASLIGLIFLFIGYCQLVYISKLNQLLKEIFILIFDIIEIVLMVFIIVLELLSADMKSGGISFILFFNSVFLLLLGLMIVIVYTLKLKYLKYIGILILLLYSTIIFAYFYLYAGFGFVVLELGGKETRNLLFNVKDFDKNGWNDCITIIYYGISKTLNFNDIKIGFKNDVKQNLSIAYIQLSLISYLFNLVYISIMISIFGKLLGNRSDERKSK